MHLMELKKRGLDVRVAKPTADARIDFRDLERLVDKKTRLIEISSAAMYNGFQHDLKAVADLAHAHGALVYVDVIHSVGSEPFDVRASGIDFASCSSFKWLMGDFGLGFTPVTPKDGTASVVTFAKRDLGKSNIPIRLADAKFNVRIAPHLDAGVAVGVQRSGGCRAVVGGARVERAAPAAIDRCGWHRIDAGSAPNLQHHPPAVIDFQGGGSHIGNHHRQDGTDAMLIITRMRLTSFGREHADAAPQLLEWIRIMRRKRYGSPREVLADFPSVDFIGRFRAVFNICHNRYRLVVDMRFDLGRIYVRHVVTHAEYERLMARDLL
jgi:mRNA-degrading endonuclease HigB of HigAB toxin-antitoxin module